MNSIRTKVVYENGVPQFTFCFFLLISEFCLLSYSFLRDLCDLRERYPCYFRTDTSTKRKSLEGGSVKEETRVAASHEVTSVATPLMVMLRSFPAGKYILTATGATLLYLSPNRNMRPSHAAPLPMNEVPGSRFSRRARWGEGGRQIEKTSRRWRDAKLCS